MKRNLDNEIKYLKITYPIKVNIQSMFNKLQPNSKKKAQLKNRQ